VPFQAEDFIRVKNLNQNFVLSLRGYQLHLGYDFFSKAKLQSATNFLKHFASNNWRF